MKLSDVHGDAPPVAQSVVDLAERLVGRYATTEHLVEVSPGEDGALSFIWNDDKGNYIYLDVGPGDTVHLYHDLANGSKWEGISVAADARILDRIARAFWFVVNGEVSFEECSNFVDPCDCR
jgi:hypothetical protein